MTFTDQPNTPQGPYVALVGADDLDVGGDFTEVNGKPAARLGPVPGAEVATGNARENPKRAVLPDRTSGRRSTMGA